MLKKIGGPYIERSTAGNGEYLDAGAVSATWRLCLNHNQPRVVCEYDYLVKHGILIGV